jgi:hypothetical protein
LWAHARQQQHFFAFLSFFLLCLCDSFGMFSLKKTLLCPAHRYKLNIFVWKAKRIKAVHCSSSILYNTRHSSGHGAKLRGIRDDRIPSIKSTFGERGKFFLSCSCHVRVWFRSRQWFPKKSTKTIFWAKSSTKLFSSLLNPR